MITDPKARETLPTDKRIAMALEYIATDLREIRNIAEVLLADVMAAAKERAKEREAREARDAAPVEGPKGAVVDGAAPAPAKAPTAADAAPPVK